MGGKVQLVVMTESRMGGKARIWLEKHHWSNDGLATGMVRQNFPQIGLTQRSTAEAEESSRTVAQKEDRNEYIVK